MEPIAHMVTFQSENRQLDGYLSHPEGKGPFPADLWNRGSEKRPGWHPELGSFYNSHRFVFFLSHRRVQGRSRVYIMDEITVTENPLWRCRPNRVPMKTS